MTGWTIEAGAGLTPSQYQEVVRLQGVCEAMEGVDLTGADAGPQPRLQDTFLAYSADQLVGYCGIEHGHDAEVCGMVDPAHRRRGIAGGLLGGALAAVADGHKESALVMCEDASCRHPVDATARRDPGPVGAAHGAQAEQRWPLANWSDVTTEIGHSRRPARLVRLLSDGFPDAAAFIQTRLAQQPADEETLMAYEEGTLVGATRLVTTSRRTMIYGFVIDRALRGQGRGRSMMRAVLDWLRDRGVTEVGLEVEAGKVAAVRLYGGFGFQVVTTYRYMRIPV